MIVLLVGSLLTARVNDARLEQIPPVARQQGTFDSLRAFLLGESQRQPVVVVLDDLHWIDQTSEKLLLHLIGSVSTQRLLLILCHRPDYLPAWGNRSAVVPLALRPLAAAETLRLMVSLLGTERLDPLLVRLVSERSEGNPFFVEELIRTFVEKGLVVRDDGGCRLRAGAAEPDIPTTIQDVIMARIDRLDEPLKRILQLAAVIGRDFPFKLLRALVGSGDDLRRRLAELEDLELICEKTIFPEWEFSFKHALIHQTAYLGLLSRRRRELHEQIGRIVEEQARPSLEDAYELLAYHFALSSDTDRAVRYLTAAGDKAARHLAVGEARAYYQRALALLARLPDGDEPRARAQVLAARLDALAAAPAPAPSG